MNMGLVTNTIAGRFGNRLFQIANAYAYSLRFNKTYFINDSFYQIVNILHHSDLRGIFPNLEKLYLNKDTNSFHQINENHYIYDPPKYVDDDVILNGYYQSEEYFLEYKEDILKLFDINSDIKNKVNEIWSNHLKENTASIHIRRGDYLFLNFPVIGMDYYNRCFELIKDKIDNIIVFSDDINWCKDNIKYDKQILYSEKNGEIEDLYLMSLCKYNIIANSSFSWWSSYLNKNKDRIIYAPSIWFKEKYDKIYRKDMIII